MKSSNILNGLFGLAGSAAFASAGVIPEACVEKRGEIIAPIASTTLDTSSLRNVIPEKNVTLSYGGVDSSDAVVNVTLLMKNPAVVLETIASVINVTCSANGVAVTFNDTAAFAATRAAWSKEGGFVMITNHMGGCDSELERGFFQVTSCNFNATSLVATVSSKKENISECADTAEISFGGLTAGGPSNSTLKKRVTLNPSFSVASGDSIPTTDIFSNEFLTADASAHWNASLTFSGKLTYSFWTFSLKELFFDVDAEFDAGLTLGAQIKAPYDQTFNYAPATIAYLFVAVPGIIEIGPALTFAVGSHVAANVAVDADAVVSTQVIGTAHVDAMDSSKNTQTGWIPTYDVVANISGDARVSLDPSVSLNVELGIKVLGGVIDLSTGVTAKAAFPNEFIPVAAANVTLAGVETKPSNTTESCTNGISVESNFNFELDAYVSSYYTTTLFAYNGTLADSCYKFA